MKRGISIFHFFIIVALVFVSFFIRSTRLIGDPSQKAPSQNGLRKFGKAYFDYAYNDTAPRTLPAKTGDTAHTAAFLLATSAQLNDARLYFVKSDYMYQGMDLPTTVAHKGWFSSTWEINPDFAKMTLSYEIVANLPTNAPPASTPIAWTRGLQPDGTWPKDSPWGGAGGHILFLDTHVEWFDKLSLDPNGEALVNYGTKEHTVNILEALPPGAVVLKAEPNVTKK